jgi:hypothetical protein
MAHPAIERAGEMVNPAHLTIIFSPRPSSLGPNHVA